MDITYDEYNAKIKDGLRAMRWLFFLGVLTGIPIGYGISMLIVRGIL